MFHKDSTESMKKLLTVTKHLVLVELQESDIMCECLGL